MIRHNIEEGIIVSIADFTQTAIDFASDTNMRLMNIYDILGYMEFHCDGDKMAKDDPITGQKLVVNTELNALDKIAKNFNPKKTINVDTQRLENNIQKYNIKDFKLPKEFLVIGGASPHGLQEVVDINRFLACFPNLSLNNGWILDYVYHYSDYGKPMIYARKTTESPLKNEKMFFNKYGELSTGLPHLDNTAPFISAINVKNVEGLFDLSVFLIYLQTFYLYDHANYDYREIMFLSPCVEIDENGIVRVPIQTQSDVAESRIDMYFQNKRFVGCKENKLVEFPPTILY